jgi:hypothetical protein
MTGFDVAGETGMALVGVVVGRREIDIGVLQRVE